MKSSSIACLLLAQLEQLAKFPAEKLSVAAVSAFEQVGDGFKITTMDLDVRGEVPGLDEVGFAAAARKAEQGCPVANALRNNVEIRVKAHLGK